jgi:hypothetical protein
MTGNPPDSPDQPSTPPPAPGKRGSLVGGVVLGPVVLAVGAALVGLTLFCCTDSLGAQGLVTLTAAVGVLGLVFGLGCTAAAASRDRFRVPAALAALPLAVLLAGSAAGTVAGLVSSGVHWFNEYDYGKKYGQPVQARVHDASDCSYVKYQRTEDSDITCKNATWDSGGATHRGKLMFRLKDIGEVDAGHTYPAHALGGTAFADGDGKVRPETFFGRVPWWLALVGPALALLSIVGLLGLAAAGESERAERTAAVGSDAAAEPNTADRAP